MHADVIFAKFGTNSPVWRLTGDSDALWLGERSSKPLTAVRLEPAQAATLRKLSASTKGVEMTVDLDGVRLPLLLMGRLTDEGVWSGVAAALQDTSTIVRELEDSTNFAEFVVSEISSLVVIIDSRGSIKRFNKECERLSGMRERDLIGKCALDLFFPPDEAELVKKNLTHFFTTRSSWETERTIMSAEGPRTIAWRNRLVRRGTADQWFLVCTGTDVTEERIAKARLIELANTDALTGLPNRYAIHEQLRESIATESCTNFSILFIDLDNFKQVNDHFGHVMGDKLIQEAATAIRSCLRKEDNLARLGGDEFLVVVADPDPTRVGAVCQRIIERMRIQFSLGNVNVYSPCSIGVACYPEHGATLEDLVRNADTAMYAAKAAGRGLYRVFAPEMDTKVGEYVWLDMNLRHALERPTQFQLYYQPKVCLRTNQVHSVEALIRWISPERGLMPPDSFIPYAESSGLIVPIGLWVIQDAFRQAVLWKEKGINMRIAVNMSGRQVDSSESADLLETLLSGSSFSSSPLDIELTESSLVENKEMALALAARFKAMGARIHMDDFGTGYSSLSQLVSLPLDCLKLDRSFIRAIPGQPKASALVRSMAAVAQELGLEIVAEGVESLEHVEFLRGIGVTYAQGYYFAKPMPAEEFERWLVEFSRPRLVVVGR
jgi:c-di-GMP phosphodiesterase Gmr